MNFLEFTDKDGFRNLVNVANIIYFIDFKKGETAIYITDNEYLIVPLSLDEIIDKLNQTK